MKNVIRVYPDRIAFCVNNECALYCRYCLRKRMVGDEPEWTMKKRELRDRARLDPRDAGDPRRAAHRRRSRWSTPTIASPGCSAELRGIPHVEIIRLGTRLPVTLPFRVTDELCRMLAKHHPVWLNTHFNHPAELTARGSGSLRSAHAVRASRWATRACCWPASTTTSPP